MTSPGSAPHSHTGGKALISSSSSSASSAVSPLLAMLPFSCLTDRYSLEVIGHSPSLALVHGLHPSSNAPGSLDWLNSFDRV